MTTIHVDTSAPLPGSAEYETKMASLGESLEPSVTEPEVTTERPAWLPEKFKSAEDMARAYAELEKKQSGPKPVTPPVTPPVAPETATTDQAGETLNSVGLNLDDFSNEFAAQGNLSEASYEKLAKAGIPKAMVDSYIAGQEAQAAVIRNDVFNAAGGEENYSTMVNWATKSLPASEIDAYNRVMDSGDLSMIKLAVAGLNSKFAAANPAEPRLIQGATGQSGTEAFESTAQLVAAMRNPLYKSDPAYRKSVDRKLANSNIF